MISHHMILYDIILYRVRKIVRQLVPDAPAEHQGPRVFRAGDTAAERRRVPATILPVLRNSVIPHPSDADVKIVRRTTRPVDMLFR